MLAKISKAKKEDSKIIYELGKKSRELKFSSKYQFHEISEIKEFISKPNENIVFIARINGREIGFLYARVLAHSAGGWCMLDNIYVESKYRHRHVGDSLLKELYKELKKRKIHYIQILEAANRETRAFWKMEGYKETKSFIWAERTI